MPRQVRRPRTAGRRPPRPRTRRRPRVPSTSPVPSNDANGLGLPSAIESTPSEPSVNSTNPMNMRSRASGARSRTSVNPHASPTTGNTIGSDPEAPVERRVQRTPDGAGGIEPDRQDREPGEHHQPDAHRVARVRRQDLPGRGAPRSLGSRSRDVRTPASCSASCLVLALAAGERPRVLPDARVDDGRDDFRRDGEVFVAIDG